MPTAKKAASRPKRKVVSPAETRTQLRLTVDSKFTKSHFSQLFAVLKIRRKNALAEHIIMNFKTKVAQAHLVAFYNGPWLNIPFQSIDTAFVFPLTHEIADELDRSTALAATQANGEAGRYADSSSGWNLELLPDKGAVGSRGGGQRQYQSSATPRTRLSQPQLPAAESPTLGRHENRIHRFSESRVKRALSHFLAKNPNYRPSSPHRCGRLCWQSGLPQTARRWLDSACGSLECQPVAGVANGCS